MTIWRETLLDDESMWPKETRVELPPPHADGRGAIQSLVNFPMKNVSLITSKKGSVRSNHYHLTDWHYMYVLRGSFDYYYRPTGSDDKPAVTRVSTGEMIFTPPMEDHATVFLDDTDIIVVSRNPRDQEAYEADVLKQVLALTPTPPGNNFLAAIELDKPEPAYPLELYLCAACHHVQLGHVVHPRILYQNNYTYVSSTGVSFVQHLRQYAAEM